ncbi:MAG: hypothetical protein ACE5K7_06270 [Phycisphaerae bacterium]
MLLRTISVGFALLFIAAATPGCRQRQAQRKYRPAIQGTAKTINPQTGEVSMEWYSPKRQQWIEVHGTVTDETEVLINGRSAQLSDVRPGDRVKVIGYEEGKGTAKRLVAAKIMVTREEEFSTTATAPAGPGP